MTINKIPLNEKIVCLLFLSICVLIPAYIFPSGGFQLVDVPIVLVTVVIILALKREEINLIVPVIIMLLCYAFWAMSVNMAYFIHNSNLFYLKACIQLIYPAVIFSVFVIVFQRILSSKRTTIILYIGLFLMLLAPFFITGAYDQESETLSLLGKNALSFNNPNQLGYFSVLIYAMLIALKMYVSRYEFTRIERNVFAAVTGFVFILSHIFALYSASRAGVFSVLLLDMIVVWQNKKKILIALILFIPFFMVVYGTEIVNGTNFSDVRVIRKFQSDIVGNLKYRVQGIFIQNLPGKHAIIYGAGKTIPGRGTNEVHNGYADILLSYGVIGLSLFSLFLFVLIGPLIFESRFQNRLYYLHTLFSVFVYNLTHNGFRFRFFWIFLALWYVITTVIIQRSKNELAHNVGK